MTYALALRSMVSSSVTKLASSNASFKDLEVGALSLLALMARSLVDLFTGLFFTVSIGEHASLLEFKDGIFDQRKHVCILKAMC